MEVNKLRSIIFFTTFVYDHNWRLHAIFKPSFSIFKKKVVEKREKMTKIQGVRKSDF